jgi:hypothetical protein
MTSASKAGRVNQCRLWNENGTQGVRGPYQRCWIPASTFLVLSQLAWPNMAIEVDITAMLAR